MTDYAELKRLALGLPDKPWHAAHANAGGRGWEVVQGVDQVAADLTEARAKFIAATTPAAILALIAENEQFRVDRANAMDDACLIAGERDQLKAELEALRFDALRYRALRAPTAEKIGITSLFVLDALIDAAMSKGAKP